MDIRNNNCRLVAAVVSSFLILSTTGFLNMWGNLSVYVLSYYYIRHNQTSFLEAPWVLSIFLVCTSIGFFLNGRLSCLNPKHVLISSILLFCGTLACLHFALLCGIVELFPLGIVIIGLSVGVLDCLVFKLLAEKSPSAKGRMISIACAGIYFGPCVVNPCVSFFTNPENLSPDLDIGKLKVFTQTEIINNVPYVFFILGGGYFICQTTGFIILCLAESGRNVEDMTSIEYSPLPSSHQPRDQHELESQTLTDKDEKASENIPHWSTLKTDKQDEYNENSYNKIDKNHNAAVSTKTKEQNDFSPREMMRTRAFYVLWTVMACQCWTELLVNNYYKIFGQTKISNDHLLGAVGAVLSIVSGGVTLFWGIVLDRFSIRSCLVGVYAGMSVWLLLMYFSPDIHQALYVAATVATGGVNACLYPTFVTATVAYFGTWRFDDNLGLVYSGRVTCDLIAPMVFQFLLDNFNWFSIFGWSVAYNALALVLVVFTLPYPHVK